MEAGKKKRNTGNLYTAVKEICKRRRIPISRLERDAGLANGVIRKWDRNSPTLRNVLAVANCLGVTLDDLLKEPE